MTHLMMIDDGLDDGVTARRQEARRQDPAIREERQQARLQDLAIRQRARRQDPRRS